MVAVYRIRRKDNITMREVDMKTPYHQFILSNHNGIVIRCCAHCGLSHTIGGDQRTYNPIWQRIREEEGDATFSEPCPAEGESDSPFPYHQFILSSSHNYGITVVRFCIRCGLSHVWQTQPAKHPYERRWVHIRDNEQETTLSESCPAGLESGAYKQRYEPVPLY